MVDDRYVYHTDRLGRTDHFHTDALSYDNRVDTGDRRNTSAQSDIASRGGDGYEGGHYAGTKFLGPGERINLGPMLREVNRRAGDSFAALERQWRDLLAKNPETQIAVDIKPHFSGRNTVPEAIEVRYHVNGVAQPVRIFENVQ